VSFFVLRGRRALVFLALGLILGPPLAWFIFQLGAAVYAPAVAIPFPAHLGDIPDYLWTLFFFGYLDGIFPALTAAVLLFEFRSRSGVLRLWWVLVLAYCSTCIWYYFSILVNNRVLLIGVAGSLAALVLWVPVKLLWREKAEAS
jgi:hypothetical protein